MTKREEQFSDLIFEYRKTKSYTQRCANDTENPLEKKIMNSIVRSFDEGIEYMRTGISPSEFNLTVNAKKKPEVSIANDYLMSIAKEEQNEITEEKDIEFNNLLISDLLKDLTAREKDCYLMTQQSLFTQEVTAELLNISKKSVCTYLERARKKIERRKKESLFVFAKGWGEE